MASGHDQKKTTRLNDMLVGRSSDPARTPGRGTRSDAIESEDADAPQDATDKDAEQSNGLYSQASPFASFADKTADKPATSEAAEQAPEAAGSESAPSSNGREPR